MRPAFSTIKQYLAGIDKVHYARRFANTARRKAELAAIAEQCMQDMDVMIDRIAHDKKAFAHWARNDRNQGLASRQNAFMRVHAVHSRSPRSLWAEIKRNYVWSMEHHA